MNRTGSLVDHPGRLPHPAGRALRPSSPPTLRLVPAPGADGVAEAGETPAAPAARPFFRAEEPASSWAAEPVIVVRLTPRGRGIALLVLLAAIFCLGLAFGSKASGADEAPPPVDHPTVVVQPGQTLWGIAREIAPQRDPRSTIAEIRRLNALPTAEITSGQVLRLP
jgi:nucleoid-associated protein YgaU